MKIQLLPPPRFLFSITDLTLNRHVKILQNLLGTFVSKYHYGSEGDVHVFRFCVFWIRIESLSIQQHFSAPMARVGSAELLHLCADICKITSSVPCFPTRPHVSVISSSQFDPPCWA